MESDSLKTYKNIKLWLLSHPEMNLKLNNELKSKKRELLNLFVSDGLLFFDRDKLIEIFCLYDKYSRKVPNYEIFKNYSVVEGISLYDYVLLFNYIVEIYQCIEKEIGAGTIYSEGEQSVYIDIMRNRFNQYKNSIKTGNYDLKAFIFCFLLKERFGFKFDGFENLYKKTIKFNGIDIKIELIEELFLKLKLHV